MAASHLMGSCAQGSRPGPADANSTCGRASGGAHNNQEDPVPVYRHAGGPHAEAPALRPCLGGPAAARSHSALAHTSWQATRFDQRAGATTPTTARVGAGALPAWQYLVIVNIPGRLALRLLLQISKDRVCKTQPRIVEELRLVVAHVAIGRMREHRPTRPRPPAPTYARSPSNQGDFSALPVSLPVSSRPCQGINDCARIGTLNCFEFRLSALRVHPDRTYRSMMA